MARLHAGASPLTSLPRPAPRPCPCQGPDGEGEWKEYFRAKDLVRFLVANPGKLDFALPSKRAGVGGCCCCIRCC